MTFYAIEIEIDLRLAMLGFSADRRCGGSSTMIMGITEDTIYK